MCSTLIVYESMNLILSYLIYQATSRTCPLNPEDVKSVLLYYSSFYVAHRIIASISHNDPFYMLVITGPRPLDLTDVL